MTHFLKYELYILTQGLHLMSSILMSQENITKALSYLNKPIKKVGTI